MSTRSKGGQPAVNNQPVPTPLVEKAHSLLGQCFRSIHEATAPYFYRPLGTVKDKSSIAHLLGVSDATLLGIFKYCGFVHATKKGFLDTVFDTFVFSQNLPIELTRYTKKPVIKIGALGNYPTKPRQQITDDLKPPDHRFKKNDRLILDRLVEICSTGTGGTQQSNRHRKLRLRLQLLYLLRRQLLYLVVHLLVEHV
jgi:hypothetical protein